MSLVIAVQQKLHSLTLKLLLLSSDLLCVSHMLTVQCVGSRRCRPCAVGSTPPRPSGGYLLRGGPAASHTPGSQTGRPHGWQPCLRRRAQWEISTSSAWKRDLELCKRFQDQGVKNVSWALTRVVDGVQADSSGSDETSDPLQLAVSYVVLENDVIGEVHAADWLQRRRALAADWDTTVLGVSLDSHGLGHGALIVIVLHTGQSWIVLSSCGKIKFVFLQVLKIRVGFLKSKRAQWFSCRKIKQCSSVWLSCCPVSSCVLTVELFLWRPGLLVGLFILSVKLF